VEQITLLQTIYYPQVVQTHKIGIIYSIQCRVQLLAELVRKEFVTHYGMFIIESGYDNINRIMLPIGVVSAVAFLGVLGYEKFVKRG